MSKVDWSLAPALATHAGTFKGEFTCWYWLNPCGIWRHISDLSDDWERVVANKPISDLTERPKQPQSWSGPEDGLPQVGNDCEYRVGNGTWYPCTIRYITTPISDEEVQVVINCPYLNGDQIGGIGNGMGEINFRPIRTPEQLVADKRESAIRELMDIAQVDCRVTAARLVDAGFKREVK